MKKFNFYKIIAFSLLLIIVSCQNSSPMGAPEHNEDSTISPETLATILNYIDRPNAVNDWGHTFSPDGEWFIKFTSLLPGIGAYEGFSLKDPRIRFETHRPLGTSLGQYQSLSSWAPDSSSFAVRAADEIGSGCFYDRVVIYNREDKGYFLPSVFEPDTNFDCLRTTWALDSSMIAVTITGDPYSILLVDKKGNLVQKIDLDADEKIPKNISPVYWTESSILFTVDYAQTDKNESFQTLYVLNPNGSEQPRAIFSDYNSYFNVVGIEPNGSRILVQETKEPTKNDYFKLHIYNLETDQIEETKEVQGKLVRNIQQFSPYPAFQIETEYLSQNYRLSLFDWEEQNLVDYGSIESLVTWLPSEKGFLVVQKDEEGQYFFNIVEP